jgi:L-ascorbate metabolism protein UlaG (beta-lactamase superfamily)
MVTPSYIRRYTSPPISPFTILKWQMGKYFAPKVKANCSLFVRYHKRLPHGEYALWLGHATVWMHLGKMTFAIDPVLGNIPFYPRHTPLPIAHTTLRSDVILITHAHYDHCDIPSIQTLLATNPHTHIVAPWGFWRYLKTFVPKHQYHELHWWEEVRLGEVVVTLVPAFHWSRRTPWDKNQALWGGYVLQHAHHTLYHSGDSAMGDHFGEIGEKFRIDEAFLPIGAYQPEAIMKSNHINPLEALEACTMLRAKTLIPIHYGTFRLSDESLDEPLEWLKTAFHADQYPFETTMLGLGEVYVWSNPAT